MSKIRLTGNGDALVIYGLLERELLSEGSELVDSEKYNVGTTSIIVSVYEKFYMRASNRASLTIIVSSDNDGIVNVDAITSGGGQGRIFKMDWGAENSYLKIVTDYLKRKGFVDRLRQ